MGPLLRAHKQELTDTPEEIAVSALYEEMQRIRARVPTSRWFFFGSITTTKRPVGDIDLLVICETIGVCKTVRVALDSICERFPIHLLLSFQAKRRRLSSSRAKMQLRSPRRDHSGHDTAKAVFRPVERRLLEEAMASWLPTVTPLKSPTGEGRPESSPADTSAAPVRVRSRKSGELVPHDAEQEAIREIVACGRRKAAEGLRRPVRNPRGGLRASGGLDQENPELLVL